MSDTSHTRTSESSRLSVTIDDLKRRNSIGICNVEDVIQLYKNDFSYTKLSAFFNQIHSHTLSSINVFELVRTVIDQARTSNLFVNQLEQKQYIIASLKLIVLDESFAYDIQHNLKHLINTEMILDLINILYKNETQSTKCCF